MLEDPFEDESPLPKPDLTPGYQRLASEVIRRAMVDFGVVRIQGCGHIALEDRLEAGEFLLESVSQRTQIWFALLGISPKTFREWVIDQHPEWLRRLGALRIAYEREQQRWAEVNRRNPRLAAQRARREREALQERRLVEEEAESTRPEPRLSAPHVRFFSDWPTLRQKH